MKAKIIILTIFSILLTDRIIFAENIRKAVFEGHFYPSQKIMLNNMLERFLNNVEKENASRELLGFIVPHAGYVYSGQVAAYVYKQIQGMDFDTVILIGPSHRVRFNGVSVGYYDKYTNVLGDVFVDKKLAEMLMGEYKTVKFLPQVHEQEHSLEVQLPFLQKTLDEFKILPLVMGNYNVDICKNLGRVLHKLTKNKKVIFIASSDLSHYYSYERALKIDQRTIKGIKNLNMESFLNGVKKGKYELCGAGAVGVLLSLAENMERVDIKLLNYSNSGDVSIGNKSNVVGYSSIVLFKKGLDMESENYYEKEEKNDSIQIFEYLNDEEEKIVLDIARKSIKGYLIESEIPEFDYQEYPHLSEKRGVFVTIYKNGMLKGCIGRHESDKPLYELVPEIAVLSAFKDSRFVPLREDELDDITLEVSVYLSKLVKIKDINQYKVGEHGIILKKGFKGATYLPKVPIEQGWNKEETLKNLCYKAGLPVDAWKDEDIEFYIYATQVIKEK